MNEKIKTATGIDVANCSTCSWLGSDGDGDEYNGTWPVCNKTERMSNLSSFPFKKEMKCWEPEFWASKFSNMVRDDDRSLDAALDAFRDAIKCAEGAA